MLLLAKEYKFLSTPSARRATSTTSAGGRKQVYFYPRPPRGGRPLISSLSRSFSYRFLSTPSARRATAARDKLRPAFPISIHALREEGDQRNLCTRKRSRYFYPRPPRGGRLVQDVSRAKSSVISIHALREEGDAVALKAVADGNKFLSTPSARRATKIRAWKAGDDEFLSTPSARRATTEEEMNEIFGGFLSTPSARRATPQYIVVHSAKLFLSTPSARRATFARAGQRQRAKISIHALREEGDRPRSFPKKVYSISIHALREEGDVASNVALTHTVVFLSTPSARRATLS